MRRHPVPALLFIAAVDATGALLFALHLPGAGSGEPLRRAVLTLPFILSRLRRFMVVNRHVMMLLTWMAFEMGRRLLARHPAPFLGPDFNAAQGVVAGHLASRLLRLAPGPAAELLLLPMAAAAYVLVQAVLVGSLISLDRRVRMGRMEIFALGHLAGDLGMAIQGSFAGRTLRHDWGAVFLLLVPAMLLHHVVHRLQDARRALHDPKTGLYNFRFFRQALERHVSPGRTCALIFADLDHLKRMSDTLGHQAGDRALEVVAGALKDCCREEEVAARWGGEEFVLLLPGVDKRAAWRVAEQIRQRVASLAVAWEGREFPIWVSIGVAACPEDAQGAEELVRVADAALYRAKAGGRNRAVAYEGGL